MILLLNFWMPSKYFSGVVQTIESIGNFWQYQITAKKDMKWNNKQLKNVSSLSSSIELWNFQDMLIYVL